MSDEKQKLIKRYYYILTLSMVVYIIAMGVLNYSKIFVLNQNKIIFLLITFLYYIAIKNSLAGYFKKKLYLLDPELKEKMEKEKEKKKLIFHKGWYKDTTYVYAIVIIAILVLISVFLK